MEASHRVRDGARRSAPLAERLGLSLSGAKSRVQRAREKLKQQLLECCHFELDRRGHIIDYQPRCQCCETAACCADEPRVPLCQHGVANVRPFRNRPVLKSRTEREW